MTSKIENKRLAYLLGDLGNGGQERQLLYLLRQLKEAKKKVTVIIWDYNEADHHAKNYKRLGLDLVVIDKQKSLFNRILQLRNIVRTAKPAILHSYTFYLNFFTWLACLGSKTIPIGGIRSRLTLHLHETGKSLGYLSMIFPKSKVSNNEHYATGFTNSFVKKRLAKTYIVTNHLDLDQFQFHVPDSEIICTASVGRLTKEKRVHLIIDMMAALKIKGIRIVHHHAGKGPLMDQLKDKINACSLTDSFILQGEVEDVNSFLTDKHLFIHASHTEGYPNVIMEAMACGKPVVTSRCGDVDKMVVHGENGFIHDLQDIDGMIESCEKLIHNPQMLKDFAFRSRQIAEQKFNLDHLLEQTLKIYDKICAE